MIALFYTNTKGGQSPPMNLFFLSQPHM